MKIKWTKEFKNKEQKMVDILNSRLLREPEIQARNLKWPVTVGQKQNISLFKQLPTLLLSDDVISGINCSLWHRGYTGQNRKPNPWLPPAPTRAFKLSVYFLIPEILTAFLNSELQNRGKAMLVISLKPPLPTSWQINTVSKSF